MRRPALATAQIQEGSYKITEKSYSIPDIGEHKTASVTAMNKELFRDIDA